MNARSTAILPAVLLAGALLAGCDAGEPHAAGTPPGDADVALDAGDEAPVMNPPVDAPFGYRGFVYIHDRWSSSRIPGARVVFLTEDGRTGFATWADEAGHYEQHLPPGRYRVSALARGYERYSPCQGFSVFAGGQWQTRNIPMLPEGPICREDGTYGGHAGYPATGTYPRAPSARIAAEPDVVAVGETVTVRVTGDDDSALAMLWWGSLLGCGPNGGRATFAACGDENPCTRQWEVSFDAPGRYVLFANARDDLYPERGAPHQASEGAGMGCVEILVLP